MMQDRIYTIKHENYICSDVFLDWLNRQIKKHEYGNQDILEAFKTVRTEVQNMPYISIRERVD